MHHHLEPLAAAQRDERRREELVEEFVPLIAGVARGHADLGTAEHDALMRVGRVALLRALERYRPSFGPPFSTYAAWWVRQAMRQAISESIERGAPDPASDQAPCVVRPGEHACCRFAAPTDRWRVAVAVVDQALRRGDRVVYLSDRAELASVLSAGSQAAGPALERGRLLVLSAAETFAPGGEPAVERIRAWWSQEHDRALAEGFAGVTFSSDAGASSTDVAAATLECERGLDALGRPTLTMLCQYDPSCSCAGGLDRLACAHDVDLAPELAAIGREGPVEAARLRSGVLRVAGELDFQTASTTAEVLSEHFPGRLALDLAGLDFVDVDGMRALRGTAGERRVAIVSASEPVRRLLELMAWDTDPQFEILAGAKA